ncbi:MAG TPA: hypothetical protein VNX23_26895 [Bradyrhizobium sp.]|jgi:hypothetical protein|uniref:hypothetical protein n=1 Tax=Bradyrhizobium sp. TaxID=376 RepID=UPI002C2E3ABF|nr:hypothetical protein [Bradyrhizobium sp.]HXB80990.1 hypothetical protein [Bradyrhizobium sp.]
MRLSVLCAAAGIAVTALAATSPAEAAFNVIRWDNTGWCQVWGQSNPPTPWPSKYVALNKKPIASFAQALAEKDALVKKGACRF